MFNKNSHSRTIPLLARALAMSEFLSLHHQRSIGSTSVHHVRCLLRSRSHFLKYSAQALNSSSLRVTVLSAYQGTPTSSVSTAAESCCSLGLFSSIQCLLPEYFYVYQIRTKVREHVREQSGLAPQGSTSVGCVK